MRYFFLKILFFRILLSTCAFSQIGTYELIYNPKDAPRSPGDEIPIYGYQATFKLKWFHRFKYTVTDVVGDNPITYFGKWSSSGRTINVSFQSSDSLISRVFELVKLKSGSYMKPVNDYFHYYKKQ